MATLSERIKELSSLPALPDTAVRLVQALSGDEMSMEEIERIVRMDEAITVAVLRSANSVVHGSADRTFSLQESLTRLGSRRLQRLALSLSAGRILQGGVEGYGLQRGQLWQGSLCGALGAELVAQETGLEEPGMCFVGGLLRDVGKLAMDAMFDTATMEAEFRREHADQDQLEVERGVFGVDHAELGAELCALWGLPERLVATVRWHHEPSGREPAEGEDYDALIDIVHAADVMTCWLAVGVGYDGLAYRVDERAARAARLDREAIDRHLPELRARLDRALEQMQPSPDDGASPQAMHAT